MGPNIRAGRAALAILILILAAGAFPAPGKLATLDEVAAAGAASSLDYARAKLAAEQAASNVPDLIKLKSAALSASYSYAEAASPGGAASSSGGGYSLSATIPVIDQVGFSASLSKDLSSSFALNASPLAHSDAREQALIAYKKAIAAESDAGKAAGNKAVVAALAWMSAERQLATAQGAATLKGEAYEAAVAANAVDAKEVTLDDLVAAMSAWSDSRTALARAQSSARSAETALYAALGSAKGQAEVASLDTAALASALAALEARYAGADTAGAARGLSLVNADLDLASAQAKAAATWAFQPDLSLSGGLAVSSSGSISPKASATLTLSLDDIQGEKRSQALASVDIARRSLTQAQAAQDTAYAAAVSAVQAAKDNSESRRAARDSASELAQVAALNLKSGDASALDKEGADLSFAQAEDSYFSALADEYSAWLELGALAAKGL